ncbi:MAG: Gfo/Idh/MocA family oxidoreductase [Candidatus Aenigmarchaeota archaeon]|nr:Gfo/Idh/MocA family oxidoreductase [Candidatus Aenigmarchaeota archaeon]
MGYRIGAVGMGHWFERLQEAVRRGDRISVVKAAGIRSYDEKMEIFAKAGVPRENYFRIKPFEPLPDEFFEGIEIVYIASPNQFHAEQVIQALSKGKFVVVEKTIAVNEEEFNRVMDYIKNNGLTNKIHLHLHYLRKALTMELPSLLLTAAREYGKISSVSATFFEQKSAEDLRRAWLLRPENGGIFMDWVHPMEILYRQCGARFLECLGVKPFIINSGYDTVNPTAVEARFALEGLNFTEDAVATIRVGKGFEETRCKTVRFYFESGSFLDINYADSAEEYNSVFRGTWQLVENSEGKQNVVAEGAPTGMTPYEFLVYDTANLVESGKPLLSIEDISALFGAQWKFQKAIKGVAPSSDKVEIRDFIKAGLEKFY